jgi:hypothetical protein
VDSKELRDINNKEYFTSHEAASILTEAGVPYLVTDSILNMDEKQKLRQDEGSVEKITKDKSSMFTKAQLANEIFIKGSLFGVVENLCQNFSKVTVVENYGNYMKLSVDRTT